MGHWPLPPRPTSGESATNSMWLCSSLKPLQAVFSTPYRLTHRIAMGFNVFVVFSFLTLFVFTCTQCNAETAKSNPSISYNLTAKYSSANSRPTIRPLGPKLKDTRYVPNHPKHKTAAPSLPRGIGFKLLYSLWPHLTLLRVKKWKKRAPHPHPWPMKQPLPRFQVSPYASPHPCSRRLYLSPRRLLPRPPRHPSKCEAGASFLARS